MAVGKIDLFEQVFSNEGNPGAGYKVATYQGGTSTPLATFTDDTGETENSNPIVADAAGRYQCWITLGVAYKFVLMTAEDVVLQTVDNYVATQAGEVGGEGAVSYSLVFFRPGAEQTNLEHVFGVRFEKAVTFPAGFSGSQPKVPKQLPTGSTIFTIKKNDVTVGTCTYDTAGVGVFSTVDSATVSFAIGDDLDVYGPATGDATIGSYGMTFLGEED